MKGIPGTTFQFLISNKANQTYSARTGKFEDGGGIIDGTIPRIEGTNYYGEWNMMVKIPRTITTEAITIQLVDGTPVAHELITSVETAAVATSGGGSSAAGAPQVLETSVTVLTVGVDRTDTTINQSFLGEIVTLDGGKLSDGSILLGKGNIEPLKFVGEAGQGFEGYEFKFMVLGYQDKFIKINRQPRFSLPRDKDNFVAWDSGSTKAEGVTSDGTTIGSDWDFDVVGDGEEPTFAVKSGINVGVKMFAEGIGKEDAVGAFQAVVIRGHIEVNNISKFTSTLNLRLHNFLSQVDPT